MGQGDNRRTRKMCKRKNQQKKKLKLQKLLNKSSSAEQNS